MELYIDNTLCDIDPAENRLTIAFDASALGDIDSLREGRHYRLTIPASRRNRSIIGDRDRIRSFEMFNSAAHTARIEYDGVPLIEGTAYLTGCRQSSDGGSYSIEVVAGSHRWAKTASLRQLSQTGLEYACRFDSAAIEQSWAEDDATVRLLPVIRDSYGAQPSAVELLPVQHIPSSDDYHPFISVHKMLEAIFADAGYTVESRFFAGELFRSLIFSGQYHTRDTARLDARLGFRAGRSAQSEAAADSYGCVYADPYTGINTVGNLVDTVQATETAADLRAADGSFRLVEGEAVFSPSEKVTASIAMRLHYATDYRIESRTRLRGFDRVRLDLKTEYRFTLANRFEDYRPRFHSGMEYRAVVFGHTEGDSYRICYTATRNGASSSAVAAEFSSQSCLLSVPSSVEASDPVLYRKAAGSAVYEPCTLDWALYGGHVAMTGRTEVDVTVCTAPREISASSPFCFRDIAFGGADEGQRLTLCEDTRAWPVFRTAPAVGSTVTMADITAHGVRQATLLEALRQMFDLKFYTDPIERKVYVEPDSMFFSEERVIDWSDRMVGDGPVEVCELGAGELEYTRHCYRSGDGAVARYNRTADDRYGEWTAHVASHLAGEGEREVCNVLFAPTINASPSGAEAVSLPQVGDRDGEDDSLYFPAKILSYRGLRSIPAGWSWGLAGDLYPLAVFHGAGETSLCFEDRDGEQGLHRYHDRHYERIDTARSVTVRLRLTAADVLPIIATDPAGYDLRALFRLTIDGEEGLYRLEAIEEFRPDGSAPALCRFTQWV